MARIHNENKLITAVKTGNIELARKALAGDAEHPAADINFEVHRGQTVLFEAVRNNQPELITFLLDNGADIEKRQSDGCTPLIMAAKFGHIDAIKCLLERGANVNACDDAGQTAASFAAEKCDVNILRQLVAYHIDLNTRDKADYTILMDAFRDTYSQKIDLKDRYDVVRFLVEQGVDVNKKTDYGLTALMMATCCRDETLLRFLIENGANIDAQNKNGETALMYAAIHGDQKMVQTLVEHGANVLLRNTADKTVLTIAAEAATAQTVEYLLQNGAQKVINAVDKSGHIPFSAAFYERAGTDVLEVLLKYGSKFDSKRYKPYLTLLMTAAGDGLFDKVKFLVDHNVPLNIQNSMGDTALHMAAYHNEFEIVKYMVEGGARFNIKNRRGYTAYDYVLGRNPELAKELKFLRKNKIERETRQIVTDKTGDELFQLSERDARFVKQLVTTKMVLEALRKMTYNQTRRLYKANYNQWPKSYRQRIEDMIRDKRQNDN